MGRYKNAGIGVGIGTSPQTALENNEYENKVHALEGKLSELKAKQKSKKSETEDTKSLNESNFPFEESKNKYDKYLFDLNHIKGQSKAKFLKEVLGYKLGDGKALHKAILDGIANKKPDNIEQTIHGLKCTFNTSIKGLDGNFHQANVVIVVQQDNGKVIWRLITLYPGKKEK